MALNNPIWPGCGGINVFGPMGGPVKSSGVYPDDPFVNSAWGSWRDHVTSTIMGKCKTVGFDHFRIQPSPAPLLEALAAQNTTKINAWLAFSDQWVDDTIAQGLMVFYSFFLSSPNIEASSVLTGVGTSGHNAMKQALVLIAQRYANRNPKALAMAAGINEPTTGTMASFAPIQVDWYNAMRAVCGLTLSLTSPNYSDPHLISGLDFSGQGDTANGLDVTPFDNNCLIEPHDFYPSPFCLQSASYNDRYKYVQGMIYPFIPADRQAVVDKTTANINADSALSTAQKNALLATSGGYPALIEEINYAYSVPQNKAWLGSQIEIIETWRKAKGVPASSIYYGEIGAVRREARWPTGGNDNLSNSRLLSDKMDEISKRGYRWAVDHLDTSDYGLTTSAGAGIGEFRPEMLIAMDVKRRKRI